MKISKHEARDYIIAIAKNLFMEKGYLDTSFRDIAKAGDLTLGRIYVYFKKKEDLFIAVINPILEQMESMNLKMGMQRDDELIENLFNRESALSSLKAQVNLMKKYRNELNLILFKSDGFYAFDFRKMIIESYIHNMNYMMNLLKEKEMTKVELSESFGYSIGSLYISIFEIVAKGELNEIEIGQYLEQIISFIYHGNMGVFGKLEENEK
ncbi:MAG: TetR/AcrR family transcriptional regulator [Tissierellia bacterium]|nr:TetR/AcrR family transcriptional regulator [Tissierellia bacterium]